MRALALLLFAAVLTPLALAAPPASSENVLMVSDIHFDPFHDPAKAAQLRAADIGRWEAILSSPDSPTQAADFAKLQSACHAKGMDTDWKLLITSFKAEQQRLPHPFFVTLSGDLMVHQFDCRFHNTGGPNEPAAYAAFAAKVIAFVAAELRKAFPGTPVYIALGNNDSGCVDYHEDAGSDFLKADGRVIADSAPTKAERGLVAREFSAQGNYTVHLPGSMHRTELVVMQDVFESARYRTCKGGADETQARAQISWLRAELAKARAKKEPVWVMAHIPPGVDTYSTVNQHHDVCRGDAPVTFLSSNALGEVLDEYADVVKLAIFAHTHMDEMRLFRGPHGEFAPGKMVPSISPVNGNHPAFTLAEVNPATSTLTDYSVVVSSDNTGTAWNEEYRYSRTYGEKDFSGPSAAHLIGELAKEQGPSISYMRFYSAGDKGLRALALGLFWPQYSCSLAHDGESDYRSCVCAGGNASAPHP